MDPNPNAHAAPLFEEDHLPPRYECDYDGLLDDMPPAYAAELACANPRWSLSNEKDALLMSEYPPGKGSLTLPTSQRASDAEHNRTLDLDQVTRAIDRLYVVAPQLTSQRVELRREKIAQMQKAQHNKGKSRAVAAASDAELDKMLDLLGKASEREIVDQRVTIDPGRRIRKLDLEEQRYTYIEHIVRRSSAGRLHSQDAEQNYNVAKSAQTQTDTGLRESDTSEGEPAATLSMSSLTVPADKKSLSRSSSTPHLAWLKAAARDRSGTASSVKDAGSTLKSSSSSSMKRLSGKFGRKSRPSSSGSMIVSGFDEFRRGALDIVYVAEYHETLKHVLVFIALNAEVLPSTSSGTSGDWLLLRLSGTPSPPLTLPASVIPGVKEALGRNTHWEVKLGCSAIQQSSSVTNNLNITLSEGDDPPLLTASQLTSLIPTSYTCRSCLLPLISSPPTQYRDLPSEYWEELVDAWMCHPEGQTIAKGRMQMHCEKSGRGFGFWPTEREALVGGSYVLFERNAAVEGNITEVTGSERDDNARLIRCICGAMIGRRHERNAEDGSTVRMYRLFKYAIRPVSLTAECPKIPMSAFIVRDMLEHVQAHATYRFVLSDEEEERPRLLVWLFKPSIRISYMLASPLLLPKANSVKASKVLYKILGPDSTTDIKGLLNKYPGFPQAEHLFYPMDVCRKLAALLSESTQAYPESLQMMTDLHVGWLCRG
ncbi:hypothetical protein ID866_5195 [Astraeus odoratus]|nr:hypothetical protein ID866_5195 [Astraeus odoratus]